MYTCVGRKIAHWGSKWIKTFPSTMHIFYGRGSFGYGIAFRWIPPPPSYLSVVIFGEKMKRRDFLRCKAGYICFFSGH